MSLQLRPGTADQASQIVQDSIVPGMLQQMGFKGRLFLTNRETDKAISLNLWETEADLSAFETSPGYRQLLSKIAGLFAGPPVGELYEVGVWHTR